MIAKIKEFLNSVIELGSEPAVFDHKLAIACLLCEVCNADRFIAVEEEAAIEKTLSKLLLIEKTKVQQLLYMGKEAIQSSNSLFDFTTQLRELDRATRVELISAMWEVAYADGHLDPLEEAIIRKAAALIYVGHSDFIRTKLSIIPS